MSATRWVDGCGPPTDLCQPLCPTTPPVRDDNVDVSEAKLSRSPFSIELDDMEINTRIRGVHVCGADQSFAFSPIPLRHGVDSPGFLCSNCLPFACINLCFSTHTHSYARSRVRTWRPMGVILPEDAARCEANCFNNEQLQERRQRRQVWNLPTSSNLCEVASRRRMNMRKRVM
jgi:hypothetical protein